MEPTKCYKRERGPVGPVVVDLLSRDQLSESLLTVVPQYSVVMAAALVKIC